MENLANHPVRFNNDKNSPTLPLWMVLITLVILISGPVAALTLFAQQIARDWAPYLMFSLAYVLVIVGLLGRFDFALKSTKAMLDISWNAWSAVGAAYLLAAMFSPEVSLDGSLEDMNVIAKRLIGSSVYATALGRVAISLSEFLASRRK